VDALSQKEHVHVAIVA
jgi:hypothetical protein